MNNMATIYRCDRCRFESTKSEEIKSVTIPALNFNKTKFEDSEERYSKNDKDFTKDLCAKCVGLLYEDMKSLPLPTEQS